MTKPYAFSPRADAQQDAIWHYSARMWGEAQANSYVRGLHLHLEKLAARQMPWKLVRQIVKDDQTPVYMSRYERHWLFFRELPDKRLGVLTILHEAMDIPARFSEEIFQVPH